jgi:23S rRNA (cytidine1920-2'-O)/16S rRNA (cytidine1409-2'-O)-methyltransferase
MRPTKTRLDQLLVEQGFCESRNIAQALILAGKVRTGTTILDKPGKTYPADLPITLETPPKYVSRGAEKLEGYLKKFPIPVDGLHILDLGASTGGFTDYLLQAGAATATCVDVGHSQLHQKLRDDPRVTNLEKTNARHLQPGNLPRDTYGLIVLDLSFISLTKVLPAAWPFLAPECHLVTLVKPQFEATKQEADKGQGIIRDPAIHQRILLEIQTFALDNLEGATLHGQTPSPIEGTKGNQEFLLGLKKEG